MEEFNESFLHFAFFEDGIGMEEVTTSMDLIGQFWKRNVSNLRTYRGNPLAGSWKSNTVQSAILTFGRESVDDIPVEYMELYLSSDQSSLEHLWIKVSRSDPESMDLARSRLMLETLLTERCQVKLAPADYNNWVGELVLLLDGDESTGTISRRMFCKLFPLWYVSRLWSIPVRRSPVGHIINGWNFLDISDSGVLSPESIALYLLPYAFRVLFPKKSESDAEMKDRWIQMLKPPNPMTKAQWVNHWTVFDYLNPLAFVEALETAASRTDLARQALASLGVQPDMHVFINLETLVSFAHTPQDCSRAFALWLVTLQHSNSFYFPESVADRTTEPRAVIRSIESLRSSCLGIWFYLLGIHPSSALSPEQTAALERWTHKVIDSVNLATDGELLVLRSEFTARFLTPFESETIWTRFGANKERLRRNDLRGLLIGLYHYAGFRGTHPGPDIVEQWMFEFVEVSSFLFEDWASAYITKPIFLAVFPLVCAAVAPPKVADIDPRLAQIWPENDKILYSEPILKNLLREVWEALVPANLNLPVQDWWIDRCAARLVSAGKGVTRDAFLSIFMTQAEVDRILSSVRKLDPPTILRLLSNTVLEDDGLIPTDWVEEFYLLSDFRILQQEIDQLEEVPREQFRLSFPLWVAAHGALC